MFLYADTGDSAQADLTCDPAHNEIYNFVRPARAQIRLRIRAV